MNQPINIAILDSVPEVYWADDEGHTDSQKFVDLLRPFNSAAKFDIYYVSKNQFPANIGDYDALLLTGSSCSVHDREDWIQRLVDRVSGEL